MKRPVWIHARSWIERLALSALAVAFLPTVASAVIQDVEGKEYCAQLLNARLAGELRGRAGALGTSGVIPDTVWVGYVPGQGTNYWSIGVGAARPHADASGMWTFDEPVHGDSLQGWWPMRFPHTNFAGAILTDEGRPWWTPAFGNVVNYVISGRRDPNDPAAPGNRTFGVTGVWHRDPGNTVSASLPGSNPQAPGWTPLVGAYSAWMGLRGPGDLTVQDPITGNYLNADIAAFDRMGAGSAPGKVNKRLPGYLGNMDQMMYRDIDLSSAPPATGVTIKFRYRTNMSTSKDTNPGFRHGWHEGDPLSQNQSAPGNFISAEAGTPANSQAPIDSFQVYIGAPVDDAAWLTSLNDTRSVYDPQRRWFNEILQRDDRRWLFGVAGTNAAGQVIVNLSASDRDALLAAAASAGHPNRLRIVFRVHTNRSFDDGNASVASNYNSAYAGAAVVDDVIVDIGGGDTVIGDFESPDAIDNALSTDPLDAWKSTGKPPDAFAHAHDVATLVYQDICGPVGGANRQCDLQGTVISLGLHEAAEAASDPQPLSADHEGFWGMVSPTIDLVTTGSSTPNSMGLTGEVMNDLDDIVFMHDIYTGYFDAFTTGQLWMVAAQSYPTTQSDGAVSWGEFVPSGCLFFNPEKQCFRIDYPAYGNTLIRTTAPSGVPDSIRFSFIKLSQCYRFGVTTGCSPTDGGYLDNVSFGFVRNAAPAHLQADIWDLFNDAFPANDNPGLPGTAAFDTAAAHVKVGLNVYGTVGNLFRYNAPGDSVTVQATGDSIRLDLMFRIRPGVGNHVTPGSAVSGVRQVPTSATPAASGDGSFWGSYMANAGAFAGPPGSLNPGAAVAMHAAAPGGWSPTVWNSARMDTSESGGHAMFPNQRVNVQTPPGGGRWCSNYHETELAGPRSTLGIPRNRCFVIDTTIAGLQSSNIHCGAAAKGVYPPAWVNAVPASRTGWDGTTITVEGTKILPDGQLTPGAHVQYFMRRQDLDDPPSMFSMLPDTNVVYPQTAEGNLDGHRWQQFGVLPDRWKDPGFGLGGIGMACLLFIDGADRRGEERVWKGMADSLGLTNAAHRGAADGYGGVPGNGDINDPQYFIAGKNQQIGTMFDVYQVKGAEALTTTAAAIGSRLGYQAAGSLMDDGAGNGKWSYTGPTPDMLNTYYKIIVYASGDLNSGVLHPFVDASADDISLLQGWLSMGNTSAPDRGLMVIGDSFVESGSVTGISHQQFISNFLGATLVDPSYLQHASDIDYLVGLTPEPVLDGGQGHLYGIDNSCLSWLDVLSPNVAVPGVASASYYGGSGSPYVSAVHKNHSATHPWLALTTGYSLSRIRTHLGGTTGRLLWMYDALATAFGGLGCTVPTVVLDVPSLGDASAIVNFAGVRNNPVRSGYAAIAFGLAHDDRVELAVYDISGRKVRTLAERMFKAGAHEILWDGLDDAGNRAPRGVYFTRVRYRDSGFEQAAKLTILK